MKKLLTLLTLLLMATMADAGNVTPEEARLKAESFVKSHKGGNKTMRRVASGRAVTTTTTETASENYYVFNVGASEGFVVVSGDDRTPAILGYADQGAIGTTLPENMQAWLDGYNRQLDYLASHGSATVARAPALDEHPSISPMLQTQWDQDSPYNDLCPLDGSSRSVTGCVATAFAQVLYFHRYPDKTQAAIPAYTTDEKKIQVAGIGITTIDWNNMLPAYSGSESSAEKTAVARLMQICGSAVEMDYTSSASAASSAMVPEAMKTYFDYDAATRILDREDYRANAWHNLIYAEIASQRPVYYSGSSTGGGHAFVIDGYDRDGYFHVNWGWGGMSNGYFLLSILDPDSNSGIGASSSSDGYSFDQQAIVGAQPNTGVTPTEEVKMATYDISTDQTTVAKSSNAYKVVFTAEIYNNLQNAYTFDIAAGVYDTSNRLVYTEPIVSYKLDSGWGWGNLEFKVNVPATLADGEYLIMPVSREQGTGAWLQNANSDRYFLAATIGSNTLTIEKPSTNLSGSLQLGSSPEQGTSTTVKATIRNNGTFFNGTLYLQLDGEDICGRVFELEKGQSDVLEMTFTPTSAGEKTLRLGTKRWEYNNGTWNTIFTPVASTTISISAPKTYELSFSDGKVVNAATGKIINSDKAHLQVTVENTGTNDYNNDIRTMVLYNYNNGTYRYYSAVDTPVSIAKGEKKVVSIDIDRLQDNVYWFIIVYKTDGEFIGVNDVERRYDDLYAYRVVVPSAIAAPIADPTTTTDGTIYNLNGQKVQKVRKGLYIMNGRKVVMK